ncbi:hypothetical protein ACTMSW_09370 [Micromonospora sp. BQ11]
MLVNAVVIEVVAVSVREILGLAAGTARSRWQRWRGRGGGSSG